MLKRKLLVMQKMGLSLPGILLHLSQAVLDMQEMKQVHVFSFCLNAISCNLSVVILFSYIHKFTNENRTLTYRTTMHLMNIVRQSKVTNFQSCVCLGRFIECHDSWKSMWNGSDLLSNLVEQPHLLHKTCCYSRFHFWSWHILHGPSVMHMD